MCLSNIEFDFVPPDPTEEMEGIKQFSVVFLGRIYGEFITTTLYERRGYPLNVWITKDVGSSSPNQNIGTIYSYPTGFHFYTVKEMGDDRYHGNRRCKFRGIHTKGREGHLTVYVANEMMILPKE